MIKINLLPAEKRKSERTPLPRFGLILANIAAGAVLVVLVLFEFVRIGIAVADQKRLEDRKASLAAVAAEYDRELAENQSLEAKLREIKSIAGSPIDWWRAVDALWDVVHDNPKVWLDDLQVLDAGTAKSSVTGYDPASTLAPPYGLSFSCHSATADVGPMTKFRNDIRLNPTLKNYFKEINFSVDWTVEDQADFAEKNSLAFKVQMIGSEKPVAPATQAAPTGAVKP